MGVNARYADMPGASAKREPGGPPFLNGDAEVEEALRAYAAAGVDEVMVGLDCTNDGSDRTAQCCVECGKAVDAMK